MKSQMRTYVSAVKQQIRNPKISLKKKTHKEKQLAGAQTKYLRQLNRLNQNKQAILQTAKKRKVEFKKRLPKIQWIQRLLRLDFLKKLGSYFYFMRQSNTPPRLQLSNWDQGQRIKKYILHKPFYKKLKLNRVLQGIINKANRIVKQNRIPPKSFQRLKKRYKRNRRALFQKLAQILKRFVAPLKYPLRYRKTFNIAYNHLRKKIRIALLYLPIIAGEDLPKMREYNPTLEQRIGGRLPEVWFYMNIQALLHYISAHYHLYNPLSSIRTPEFTLNTRINSIELKRIL